MDTGSPRFVPIDTEARWFRSRAWRVEHVMLSVTIDPAAADVAGSVSQSVRFVREQGGDRTIRFDQHGLTIKDVQVDDRPVSWSVCGDELLVPMPISGLGPFQVHIDFAVEEPRKGLVFIPAKDERAAMAWTQGAMEDHHWWFPCADDPSTRCTFALRIRHPQGTVALANGRSEGQEDRGDGFLRSTWAIDQPMPLYLLNIVVGDFVKVDEGGAPPLAHWVPRGAEDTVAPTFRSTGFALRWLAKLTGTAFPWRSYGHVAVEDFFWGGMENATLTTIGTYSLIDAATQEADETDADRLVIHEAAHQWFGDWCTPRGWTEVWLSESFATFCEACGFAAWRAREQGLDEQAVLAGERWRKWRAYLSQERERYTRPVLTRQWHDPAELFDRVAYEKGAAILHHLRQLVGPETFSAALADFFKAHGGSSVETADLRRAIDQVTGEPYDWFFTQWLDRPGHPSLKVTWSYDSGATRLRVHVTQTVADGGLPYRLPTAISFRVGDRVHQRDIVVEGGETTVAFTSPVAPTWVCLDADGWLPAVIDAQLGCGAAFALLQDEAAPLIARVRTIAELAASAPRPRLIRTLTGFLTAEASPGLLREEAIGALGRIGGSQARDALVAAWSSSSPAVRRQLAKALGQLRGDARAATQLLDWHAEEGSALVRGTLLAARGAIQVSGATPILRRHLDDAGWQDKALCLTLQGLGDSGEVAAVEVLLPVLADQARTDRVRAAAAKALASLARFLPLVRPRIEQVLEQALPTAGFRLQFSLADAAAALGAAGLGLLDRLHAQAVHGLLKRHIAEARLRAGAQASEAEGLARAQADIAELRTQLQRLQGQVDALQDEPGQDEPEQNGSG